MFEIIIVHDALEDLESLTKSEQTQALDGIDRELSQEPLRQTRNKTPLRANDLANWELRIGAVRVFYDVDESAQRVFVKCVDRKDHNRLIVRGKERQL